MNQDKAIYRVKYIKCKICDSDDFRLLGIRGNVEYIGAHILKDGETHMITNIVKCNICHFVYTNPYIIYDEGTYFYNDTDKYDASCNGKQDKLFKKTISLIEEFTKRGRVLDIGAGKGEFLALAKKSGWDVYGVEMSEKFADYAKNRYNLNIEKKSLSQIGYPGKYFDVVTLNMVLEHIEEPNGIMKEIHRILKDDGIVIIEIPNMNSLMLKAVRLYFLMKGKPWSPLLSPLHKPYHSYGYYKFTLKFLLNRHNLRIVKAMTLSLSSRGVDAKSSVYTILKAGRDIMATVGNCIGMGDIMTVIAKKMK